MQILKFNEKDWLNFFDVEIDQLVNNKQLVFLDITATKEDRRTFAKLVKEIAKNPDAAYDYTTKGNLVAVISNGSAILGLGNLGAIASKPVMEGKAVLFKRFADIDAIDLEIDSKDPEEIVNSIKNFAVSFGGINLEDIAAPECFIIEENLKKNFKGTTKKLALMLAEEKALSVSSKPVSYTHLTLPTKA